MATSTTPGPQALPTVPMSTPMSRVHSPGGTTSEGFRNAKTVPPELAGELAPTVVVAVVVVVPSVVVVLPDRPAAAGGLVVEPEAVPASAGGGAALARTMAHVPVRRAHRAQVVSLSSDRGSYIGAHQGQEIAAQPARVSGAPAVGRGEQVGRRRPPGHVRGAEFNDVGGRAPTRIRGSGT